MVGLPDQLITSCIYRLYLCEGPWTETVLDIYMLLCPGYSVSDDVLFCLFWNEQPSQFK